MTEATWTTQKGHVLPVSQMGITHLRQVKNALERLGNTTHPAYPAIIEAIQQYETQEN